MAEHDDLKVLGTAGTNSQTGERGDEAVKDVRHSYSASAAVVLFFSTAEYSAPTGRTIDRA